MVHNVGLAPQREPCALPKRSGPGGVPAGARAFSAAETTAIPAAAQNSDMAAAAKGGSGVAGPSLPVSSSEDCATAQLKHMNKKNIFVMVIIMLVCHLVCECMSDLVKILSKSCQNSHISQSSQNSRLALLNFHRK
jgi:hypothetical protein